MSIEMKKLQDTPHLEGSKLQVGDSLATQVTVASLRARFPDARWVISEKLDGAQAGVSFSPDLDLLLQCRGHYLTGGAGEFQFAPFKAWAAAISDRLLEVFEDRYLMFGEWTYVTHSQFYDALPHYFHEFDIWDKRDEVFLSSDRRAALLKGLPIVSAPVLHAGDAPRSVADIRRMIVPSAYRSPDWREVLRAHARDSDRDPEDVFSRTADDDRMEGVYGKLEQDGQVVFRWKFVNDRFTQTVLDRGDRFNSWTMVTNLLRERGDIMRLIND